MQTINDKCNAGTFTAKLTNRSLAWIVGPSAIYALSALFLTYGIAKLLAPAIQNHADLVHNIFCLGTLQAYELALFAAALIIIIRKRMYEDAVSLVILLAIFPLASGITLEIMSPGAPMAVLLLGLAALMIAWLKVRGMRKWIMTNTDTTIMGCVFVTLAWNFLAPGVMGWLRVYSGLRWFEMYGTWIASWSVLLLPALLLYIKTFFCRAGAKDTERKQEDNTPFLCKPPAGWLFFFILLIAGSVHQYAVSHIFDIRVIAGDFLVFAILATLLLVEVMRVTGFDNHIIEYIIGLAPLAALIYMADTKQLVQHTDQAFYLYPSLLLFVAAAAFAATALYHRRHHLLNLALAYVLGIVMISGTAPLAFPELHWQTGLPAIIVMLFLHAIINHRPTTALAAIVMAAIFPLACKDIQAFARLHDINLYAIAIFATGVGLALVQVLFKDFLPAWAVLSSQTLLALGTVVTFLESDLSQALQLSVTLGLLTWMWVMFFVTQKLVLHLPLAWPVLTLCFRAFRKHPEWGSVILAFCLIIGGVMLSLHKGGEPAMEKEQTK